MDKRLRKTAAEEIPEFILIIVYVPIIGFYMVKVKEMMQEGLIHNFWISSGGIIKIRESAGLAPFSVSHENDLILEY